MLIRSGLVDHNARKSEQNKKDRMNTDFNQLCEEAVTNHQNLDVTIQLQRSSSDYHKD